MRVVCSILIAVTFLDLAAFPVRVEAQQTGSLQPTSVRATAYVDRAKTSKTELANRFQEIKNQYASVRTATAKFAPLKSDAPPELRVTRLKIDAAMRSYDYYEFLTQKQRDQLNLLTDLSSIDSLRLQVSMDRLSKMNEKISSLMKKINETGDALAQNTK